MPSFYGVFLDIKGRHCAVFGGDEHEAQRKVVYLLECGAKVILFAKEEHTSDTLKLLAKDKIITWHKRNYIAGDLTGIWLAIVADTSDTTINQAIHQEAEEKQVLLNVMDVTHLCNFIAPALVHQDPVTVAISTAGASPALARKLREEISGKDCKCMLWASVGNVLAQARTKIRQQGIVVCPQYWQDFMTQEWLSTAMQDQQKAVQEITSNLADYHCTQCEPFGRCQMLEKNT